MFVFLSLRLGHVSGRDDPQPFAAMGIDDEEEPARIGLSLSEEPDLARARVGSS